MQEDNFSDPLIYREPEETPVKTFPVPDRAMNVEAAMLSTLAEDDTQALQKYQQLTIMPKELQARGLELEYDKLKRNYDDFIRQGMTNVLVDTTIPSATRTQLLENVGSQTYAPNDPAALLATSAVIAPSEGETEVGAEVRNILAEGFVKSHDYLDEKQQIVNNAVNRHNGGFEQAADMLSMLLTPGQDASSGVQLASKLGKSILRGVALPGSLMQDLNKEFLALPVDERIVFTKTLAEAAAQSSGILTNQNLVRYQALMQDLTDEEGFSDAQEAWVNVLNLLDFIGIGMAIKGASKAAGTAARSLKARREQASSAFSQFERSGRDVPMDAPPPQSVEPIAGVNGEATIRSTPEMGANTEQLGVLYKERESLIAEAANELDKGTVTKLEAEREAILKAINEKLPAKELKKPGVATKMVERRADLNAQLTRVDDQLARNASGNQAAQRLAELDQQISKLEKSTETVPIAKNPIQAAIDRAYTNAILAPSHPRAPATILSQTNFSKGRAAYAQAIMDETGQFSEAMYGVSRPEAIVSQIAPQFSDATGRVVRKMDDPEKAYRGLLATGLDRIVNNIRDGLRYTPAELASGRASVVKDYTDTTDLIINDAMTSVKYDGDKVIFSGVYTNGQGGWPSAQAAIDQAKYVFRKRGVDDPDITLMKLEGDEFVPVAKNEAGEGVYAIRIDVEDQVRDKDITHWDDFDVKRNFFDRFAGKGKNSQGSFTQHIVEPNSMFRKELTGSFAVGEDKSALVTEALLTKFESFGQTYRKLDKEMRQRVEDYLIRANIEEIPFDAVALRGQFPQHVVDMLRDWRDAWDDMFQLENADLIKSLQFEGYQLFKHPNLEAVVKKATQGYKGEKIYDPASDTSKVLSDAELKDIRDRGGYIARFRSPMNLNGNEVGFMIVRDTPHEYARDFTATDRILNYRHGYYQVSYKAPKFIEATEPGGKPKVVGVAGTTREAKEMMERMKLSDPTREYTFRGDEKNISRDRDVYWELNNSFGRLSQRHRGKLLEDTAGIQYGNIANIVNNPADSAIRAAMSLGGRIALRDAISTAKARFMNQYGHLLKETYPKEFPASRDDIFKKGEYTSKELADARSTWNYINTMENGYINAMDAGFKMAFNLLADTAGLKGWDTVEKLSRSVGDIDPTAKAKGAAFLSYLASNPFRMWIVQGAQASRIAGYSHVHMPKVMKIVHDYAWQGHQEFGEFYSSTGLSQSLNRSNLVRGTLLEAAQRSSAMGSAAGKAVQGVRRVGFDAGETFNNIVSAAAVFEKYKRLGKDVKDLRVRAEMHAEMRALTRNMNRAGDMPYNHNWLALVFTYMQVPHKFALQWADRSLSKAERARLVASDLTLWGLPAGLGTYVANQEGIGNDPILRQLAEEGLAAMFLNWSFSQISGEQSRIDFSSMSPWDLTGFQDIAMRTMGDQNGLASLITESPAGRILGLGPESRLGMALHTTARMFSTLGEDDLTRTTVVDAVDSWLRLSSGWNNLQEAVLMYQLGKATDKQGRTTDDSVTLPEIAAKVFGFGTKDTKEYYETILSHTKTIEKAKEYGKERVKETMQMIRHLSNGDMQGARAIALYTQAMLDPSNFPDRNTYQAALTSAMTEVHSTANNAVMQKFFKDIGMPSTYEDLADLGRGAPLDDERKALIVNFFKQQGAAWKNIEENNKD